MANTDCFINDGILFTPFLTIPQIYLVLYSLSLIYDFSSSQNYIFTKLDKFFKHIVICIYVYTYILYYNKISFRKFIWIKENYFYNIHIFHIVFNRIFNLNLFHYVYLVSSSLFYSTG